MSTTEDTVALAIAFILLLFDLILFCIFVDRVRISFNKSIYGDEEWQQNNDMWLKSSRVCGIIFCVFHGVVMVLLIAQFLSSPFPLFDELFVAHLYWLSESLWIMVSNLAIVLITQRMLRVYRTTNTPFTPLKQWISSHHRVVEYALWVLYLLIALAVLITYIMVCYTASSSNSHDARGQFILELSTLTAFRHLCTAIVLCIQLVIACFFTYIAHKSRQQTNWNEHSKQIISKESAKLMFVILLLLFMLALVLFTACWHVVHPQTTTLTRPFAAGDTSQRVYWAIVECCLFWLIQFLTRSRKPTAESEYLATQDLPTLTSTTSKSKLFLQRTLSSRKQKQLAIQQIRSQQLEQRKKEFAQRQKRASFSASHAAAAATANAFNSVIIEQMKNHKTQQQQQQMMRKINSHDQDVDDEEAEHDMKQDVEHELEANHTQGGYTRGGHVRLNQSDPLLHTSIMPLAEFLQQHPLTELSPLAEGEVTTAKDGEADDLATAERVIDMEAGISEVDAAALHQDQHALWITSSGSSAPSLNVAESADGYRVPHPTPISPDSHDLPSPITIQRQASSKSRTRSKSLSERTPVPNDNDHDHENTIRHHADAAQSPLHLSILGPTSPSHMSMYSRSSPKSPVTVVLTPTIYRNSSDLATFRMRSADSDTSDRAAARHSKTPQPKTTQSQLQRRRKNPSFVSKSHNMNPTDLRPAPNTDMARPSMSDYSTRFGALMTPNADAEVTADPHDHLPTSFPDLRGAGSSSTVITQETALSRSHEIMEKSERQLSKNELVDAVMEMLSNSTLNHDPHTQAASDKPMYRRARTIQHVQKSQPQELVAVNKHVAEDNNKSQMDVGLFHDIHLRPTALKRSHSDPDIKVRDKIWDQLLSTVEQMRQATTDHGTAGDCNVLVSKSLHPGRDEMSRRKRSIAPVKSTDLSEFYQEVALSRPVSVAAVEEEELSHTNSTQLSYVEPEYRVFNLFGYFNRKPMTATGQYDAGTQKAKKTKASSMKRWMHLRKDVNHEKKHDNEHEHDSKLDDDADDARVNPLTDQTPTQTDEAADATQNRFVGNFDNTTYRRRPRVPANKHSLQSDRRAAVGSVHHTRKRPKPIARHSKKMQTQQFLNNIHQVF